ncbi:MAG: OmpH family outer membrane protein [Candidatus Krumholzibacteriia bacterium]
MPIRFFSATMLCLIAAAMARPLVAQEVKLGFIDAARVLQSYSGYQDAEAQYEKQKEAWNQELDTRSRELKAMEEDFKAQELMLSDTKKREKLQELQGRRRELEQYYQQVFGPSGEAARKNDELLRPILEQVNEIIREVGEQEKFTMIFDSSSMGIAYAAEGVDLTEKIIERLNSAD